MFRKIIWFYIILLEHFTPSSTQMTKLVLGHRETPRKKNRRMNQSLSLSLPHPLTWSLIHRLGTVTDILAARVVQGFAVLRRRASHWMTHDWERHVTGALGARVVGVRHILLLILYTAAFRVNTTRLQVRTCIWQHKKLKGKKEEEFDVNTE